MDERVYCSSVRGHHIYKEIWSPVLGEILTCTQEQTNVHDIYAVAVKKGTDIVGHVPRSISCLYFFSFLERGGTLECEITGRRRDLPQGGLEVPCKLKYRGSPASIKKINMLLPDAPTPGTTASETSIPAKKFKLDSDVKLDLASGVWLSLNVLNEVISLSHSDRRDLCDSDKMLNDNHINFAQNLLRMQFPLLEGLQSVLLQEPSTRKKLAMEFKFILEATTGSQYLLLTPAMEKSMCTTRFMVQ